MKKIVVFLFVIVNALACFSQESPEQKDAKRRMFIDDFLATYEAAYEKKDSIYIKYFFSDDALIITETKKLSPVGKEIAPSVKKSRPYETIVESRKDYIKRLRIIFDSNVSIKLNISGVKIRQHAKYPEIYLLNHYLQK